MAKKVTGYIKLQIPAGKATPAPPVGPALGQHGVNIVQFTKEFNARTADKGDLIIPVVITVYADRSFSFITKTPPAAVLLKKACNIKSGSGVPNKNKSGDHLQGQSPRDRRDEDAGSERCFHRGGHEHDRRYRQKHGYRSRRLSRRACNNRGRDNPAITTRRL